MCLDCLMQLCRDWTCGTLTHYAKFRSPVQQFHSLNGWSEKRSCGAWNVWRSIHLTHHRHPWSRGLSEPVCSAPSCVTFARIAGIFWYNRERAIWSSDFDDVQMIFFCDFDDLVVNGASAIIGYNRGGIYPLPAPQSEVARAAFQNFVALDSQRHQWLRQQMLNCRAPLFSRRAHCRSRSRSWEI